MDRAYSKHTEAAVKLLATHIKIRRKEKQWTEKELAERTGVSRATIQKIESADMGCSIGFYFEAAIIVGLPLFDDDLKNLSQAEKVLSLLPQRVRASKSKVDDDF